MAASALSRSGQINRAGDAFAIFLKVFAQEVITAFNQATVMMSRHTVRTIDSGKSAQFPVVGRAVGSYHTIGDNLLEDSTYLHSFGHNEKVIAIDHRLVAPTFVADVDEAMNHYDVRGPYSSELGNVLAKTADTQLLQLGILAAQTATGNITGVGGTPSGTEITEADFGSTAATPGNAVTDTVDVIMQAAQTLDDNSVPKEDRYMFVPNVEFYWMLNNLKDYFVNTDYRGSGSLATGELPMVAGFQVVPSLNFPTGVVADNPLWNNVYEGTFTNQKALFMHKSAIGTVKLRDVELQMDEKIEYQGTLMVARLLAGHGILRPESAVCVKTA